MFFRQQPGNKPQSQFGEMNATQLYCTRCQRAMPVRERLALYLPSGALYHYVCAACGELLGKKESKAPIVR
ncbi:MAG: cytoplasmic protein [Candidatus Riflebacteria bacterium]|nr:cytoplasmic protein [Candidatus Riflebacteria bacterium]